MSILEVNHVKKIYSTRFGSQKVEALADVSFTVEEGEYVAIMGESGSGKTTLLNILAALDRPTAGTVLLAGRDLSVDIPQGHRVERRFRRIIGQEHTRNLERAEGRVVKLHPCIVPAEVVDHAGGVVDDHHLIDPEAATALGRDGDDACECHH